MDTDVNFADPGRGGPVDVADRVAGLVGTNAADQEGIVEQLPLPDDFAQRAGQRNRNVLRIQKPGVDQHGNAQLDDLVSFGQAKHIACSQGNAAQVIVTPVEEPNPVAAADLLMGHDS